MGKNNIIKNIIRTNIEREQESKIEDLKNSLLKSYQNIVNIQENLKSVSQI